MLIGRGTGEKSQRNTRKLLGATNMFTTLIPLKPLNHYNDGFTVVCTCQNSSNEIDFRYVQHILSVIAHASIRLLEYITVIIKKMCLVFTK